VVAAVALLFGLALLVVTIEHTDFQSLGLLARQLGAALPLVMIPGGLWHFVRTVAWKKCFPAAGGPPLGRLFRVRLAAEAFSFVTIRGVAGEPLKVVLLQPDVASEVSTAAVALERIAYLVMTTCLVCVTAIVALATLPLPALWVRIFVALATASGLLVVGTVLLIRRSQSRPPSVSVVPTPHASVARRFGHALSAQVRELLSADRGQLRSLMAFEAAAYGLMAAEVWLALWAAGSPVTITGAIAVETFTRTASMLSAFIPANLGALEASNAAAAVALHAAAGAAALALVRRLRGLIWCIAGFAIYPRGGSRAASSGSGKTLVVVDDPHSASDIAERLGGMRIGERILVSAARAGYARAMIWTPRQ
jgi:hypothetical protein